MPRRVEYFDDPNTPKPNSLVVAVSAVVANDRGEILLQKRTDNDCGVCPAAGWSWAEASAKP